MNTNIMKTQIFHAMKLTSKILKGHIRHLKICARLQGVYGSGNFEGPNILTSTTNTRFGRGSIHEFSTHIFGPKIHLIKCCFVFNRAI